MDKQSRSTFHSRQDRMVESLRRDMSEGIYKPGDFLPSEIALAEKYNLGPQAVRKSLDVLVDEGVIVKIRRVGNKVVSVPQRKQVVLTIACYASVRIDFAMEQLIADFHTLHPTIHVQTLYVKSDHDDMFHQLLDQGHVDLVTLNQHAFQEMVEQKRLSLLAPLSPHIGIYPFLQHVFSVESQLYVQPVMFAPLILCYNKAHFREASLLEPDSTWTWNDLLVHAKTLARSDRYGLYFYPLSMNIWPALLLQSGMKFTTDSCGCYDIGKTVFMDTIMLYHQTISDRSFFPPNWIDRETDFVQLFMEGKISMIATTYSTLSKLKGSIVSYDISPLPFIEQALTTSVAIGAAINRTTKHPAAAQAFSDYLCSSRAQKLLSCHSFSIPARKEVADEIRPGDDERPLRYNMFKEIMPSFRTYRDLNLSYAQLKIITKQLQLYFSNVIDYKELCRRLENSLTLSVDTR